MDVKILFEIFAFRYRKLIKIRKKLFGTFQVTLNLEMEMFNLQLYP